ncbi:MAG TPA: PP2C family serine/threonine-protein phosphatase [Pseudonocardia sp.]|jgi:protein phosphatase
MTLVLRYSARSDRGLVRQNNQDSVYAGPRLLALADGMGGHAAGEVASKLVISALVPLDDDEPGDDLLAELREATADGNAAITNLISEQPDLEGMGTTLTAILFAGSRLGMVHVGDSRAYLMRDGKFNQITKDDTFVQSLIDEGRITEEEAQTHPQRSLLLRALTGHDMEPSLTVREARAGDRYLLCSDGLSGVVSEETLADTLRNPDPKTTADRMIELALRGGGPDNVTCIVADVVDIDFGEDAPIVGGAAGDGSDQDQSPPDSAAARASVTTLPRVAPQRIEPRMDTPPLREHRRTRTGLWVLAVLIVLIGAGALARLWVMQQYYVGVHDKELAIYQGVRGNVLGIPLQSLREGSCPTGVADCTALRLTDLQETARSAVRDGIISGDGLDGARATVRRLRADEMLPPCPAGVPAPGAPADGVQPAPGVDPVENPSAQPPETTPLPSVQLEPGKTCRPVS